ncbi:MAG: hybrid sensor histidine kinase/response regulator [Polyangiaceae bacterium]|nr:hybrid sensor histidine kinase/response regulator [Polyangiaceae bacterium]
MEDSPTQALQLRLLLEADGFRVDGVASLADALAFVAATHVDAVAFDLMLPDSTGLDGLKALLAAAPRVAVVVLTANSDERLALAALGCGAEDYLFKGQFDQSLLVRTMRYAIERHRFRAQLEELTSELRTKNAELARTNEEKNRFLSIAAHDLRNPLGVILGYTELMLSGDAGPVTDEQTEVLGVVRSSSDFMLGLINDLLDFSMIQSGVIRLDLRRTDLAAMIRKNVTTNQVVAEKKRIKLVFEQQCDLELVIDRRKFEQVLNNLVSNAIKFSHRGTRVDVRLERDGDQAIISVTDQGVGIPSGEVDKLFRPFQKTSARTTGGERSTGLGLAIVRNIVESHGGRIWCESDVGRGSTFRIALPIS